MEGRHAKSKRRGVVVARSREAAQAAGFSLWPDIHGEGGNKPPGSRLLLSRMAAIDDKLSLKSGTAGLRNILFHCRTGGILVLLVLNGRKAIPGSGIFQGNQAGIDSANQIAATAARRSKRQGPLPENLRQSGGSKCGQWIQAHRPLDPVSVLRVRKGAYSRGGGGGRRSSYSPARAARVRCGAEKRRAHGGAEALVESSNIL